MYPTPIIMATIIAFVVYILLAVSQIRRFESKFIPFTWMIALGVIGVLVFINIVYIRVGAHFINPNYNFIHSLFSLDIEGTLANTYSGILLTSVSILAVLIIITTRPNSLLDMRYWVWLVISILFGVIAYDEISNAPNLHGQDITLYGYIISGIIVTLMLLYIIAMMKVENKWRYIWVFIAIGMIGFAGVLLDNYPPFGYMTGEVALLEEVLEILGTLTILIVTMAILHDNIPRMIWNIVKFGALVSVISLAILLVIDPNTQPTFSYWLSPVISDGTRYADEPIEILGHTFSSKLYNAGDTVSGDIYFRPSYYIEDDYSFSAHLLSIPSMELVAQQDNEMLGNAGLTRYWIPDMIIRQPVSLAIPDDAQTSSAYSLAIRIWSAEDEQNQAQALTVQMSPHRMIGDDFLRLVDFSDAPLQTQGTTVTFENNIQVIIDDLETTTVSAGDKLPLNFLWSTESTVTQNWQQIIHLQHTETEEIIAFDRPPFDGHIPSSVWGAGFVANDDMILTLPDDIPNGDYTIYTGLYNLTTGQRLGIVGDFPDNIAITDTITIE